MNLHVIIGEDEYLVSETAKKIVGDGVGLEVIDSLNSSNEDLRLRDIREAESSFMTPPFLDPRKVTWWKNVGFLPGGGRGKNGDDGASEAVKLALERLAVKFAASAGGLPENQHFILSGPRLLKTSVFAKTLAGVAEVVVFAPMKPYEAIRAAVVRMEAQAKEFGIAFGADVAEKFVARVGTDMRSLNNELSKLRDYLGDRKTATVADIDAVTSQGAGVEPEIWSVTEAIGRRNLDAALSAAAEFATDKGYAVMMSSIVEKFFRQLVELKVSSAGGRQANAGKNSYFAIKNSSYLANWSLRELRIARARFFNLREKVVSGTDCGDALFEIELARALRRTVKA